MSLVRAVLLLAASTIIILLVAMLLDILDNLFYLNDTSFSPLLRRAIRMFLVHQRDIFFVRIGFEP